MFKQLYTLTFLLCLCMTKGLTQSRQISIDSIANSYNQRIHLQIEYTAYETAQAICDSLLASTNPDTQPQLYNYGVLLQALNHFKQTGSFNLSVTQIDSLQATVQDIPVANTLAYKIKAYYYHIKGDFESTKSNINAAINILYKIDPWHINLPFLYKLQALTFQSIVNNSDSAIFYQTKALDIYKKQQNTFGIIKDLHTLHFFYKSSQNHDKALEVLLEAKRYCDQAPQLINLRYNIITTLAASYHEPNAIKALDSIFEYDIPILETQLNTLGIHQKRMLFDLYETKGAQALENKNFELANRLFSKMKTVQTDSFRILTTDLYFLDLYLSQNDYKQAHLAFEALIKNHHEGNYLIHQDYGLHFLATRLYSQSNAEPSLLTKKILYNSIKRVKDLYIERYNKHYLTAIRLKIILYLFDNKNKEAIHAISEVSKISDSLATTQQLTAIEKLELAHAAEEQENKLLIEKLTVKQQNYQLFIALCIIVVLILLFVYSSLFLRQKEKHNKLLSEEVKKQTAQLLRTNQNLKQSNKELERFAYISSHDLKEPLRNIISFTGLAKDQIKDQGGRVNLFLDYVNTNAHQMFHLIEAILNFSKVSNSTIELLEVAPKAIFNSICKSITHLIKECNVIVTIEDMPPSILSDKTLLFIVFKNLFENSIKYNQSEQPTINVSYKKSNVSHYFLITDNGIGIDEQYHDMIFDMFKRLHNKATYQGSGIGLAICKKAIGLLDGKISVNSQLNKGSTFIVQLPIQKNEL